MLVIANTNAKMHNFGTFNLMYKMLIQALIFIIFQLRQQEGNMGGISKSKPLTVATLNFAGLTLSPFEFYSGTQQQKQVLEDLSNIFMDLYKREQEELNNQLLNNQLLNNQLLKLLRGPEKNSFSQNQKEQEKEQLSEKKVEQEKQGTQYIPDITKWDISNIDKSMQRERYSPLYRRDAGILYGRLMAREEFQLKWEQQFKKNQHQVKFKSPPTLDQKARCKIFDYLIFKTLVQYTYKFGDIFEGQSYVPLQHDRDVKSQELNSEGIKRRRRAFVKYQEFLGQQFAKPYLKLKAKIASINKIMQKTDILFLQDASQELINSLKNQGVVSIVRRMGIDSAILLKQGDKFKTIYDQQKVLKKQGFGYQKNLDGSQNYLNLKHFYYNPQKENLTSIVGFVDNFILINIHIGKVINEENKILKVMRHLLKLKEQFKKDLHIIAAGDFNTFFIRDTENPQHKSEIQSFYQIFSVFPQKQQVLTTKKKRTSLHSQNDKYQLPDQRCVDFIISSLKLQNTKVLQLGPIIQIENFKLFNNPSFNFLTQDHPFDHLIVQASVSPS